MAQTLRIDELNVQKQSKIVPIPQFFREMDLPEDEIEERIDMAEQMKPIFLWLFALVTSYLATGAALPFDYLVESTRNRMMDFGADYGLIEGSLLPKYEKAVAEHIQEVSEQIVQTTIDHAKQVFFVSDERATALAENETNVFSNTLRENRAVRRGLTHKTWVTEGDNKVRDTHSEVDGKTIGIDEMFEVGDSLMRFPCDPNGSVGEIANCRCVCEYS